MLVDAFDKVGGHADVQRATDITNEYAKLTNKQIHQTKSHSFATDDKVFPSLQAGALGFLLKDTPPEMLVDGIRQVYRGESWLHPKIARKVLQELTKPKESAITRLSSKESITSKL